MRNLYQKIISFSLHNAYGFFQESSIIANITGHKLVTFHGSIKSQLMGG